MSLLLMCLVVQSTAQVVECESIVYPGDFNKDGVVSVHDVLYWGVMYGTTGPDRPIATNDWTPQFCPDWTGTINNVNNKNQDGNGDGVIDTLDLQALYQNYDSTHTCIVNNQPISGNTFAVYYTQEQIGTMLRHEYHLYLKNSNDYHGCAFTMDYSELDAVIEIGVDTIGSDLEPTALVVIEDTANKKIHVAATRTNQMDASSEKLLIIVICEDIAGLTGEQKKVFFADIESIKSDYKVTKYDTVSYISPPFPPQDICEPIFDLEYCQYQNGIINTTDPRDDRGTCFEGRLYGSDAAGLPMSCNADKKHFTSDTNNTLWFYIKTDAVGFGQAIDIYLVDTEGNESNKVSTGMLGTNYQKIGISIDSLLQYAPLGDIEYIYFRKTNSSTLDFRIYVDYIYTDPSGVAWWSGDKYTYGKGTLNDTEVCTGSYSFQGIHSGIGYGGPILSMLPDYYNLSLYDEICFNVKADKPGKTLKFAFAEPFYLWYKEVYIDDYIQNNSLTTEYKKVCIPLDSLKADCAEINCKLGYVNALIFYSNEIDSFNFYIDDIRVIRGDAKDCTVGECFDPVDIEPLPYKDILFTIFPNPVSDQLNIQINYNKNTKGHIEIIDLQGKLIYTEPINLSQQLDFSYQINHLKAGVYIIHITDEDGNLGNNKFIKM